MSHLCDEFFLKSLLPLLHQYLPTQPSSPDLSKALILHPIYSDFSHTHPEYNQFTSLNAIPDYPTYDDNDLLVDDLLNHLSISMESASIE